MLFVPRKDGSHQMCVYYRVLNEVTIENKYHCQGWMIYLVNSMVYVCSPRLIFDWDRIS
jgi:hypothetical protein